MPICQGTPVMDDVMMLRINIFKEGGIWVLGMYFNFIVILHIIIKWNIKTFYCCKNYFSLIQILVKSNLALIPTFINIIYTFLHLIKPFFLSKEKIINRFIEKKLI